MQAFALLFLFNLFIDTTYIDTVMEAEILVPPPSKKPDTVLYLESSKVYQYQIDLKTSLYYYVSKEFPHRGKVIEIKVVYQCTPVSCYFSFLRYWDKLNRRLTKIASKTVFLPSEEEGLIRYYKIGDNHYSLRFSTNRLITTLAFSKFVFSN